MTDKEIDQLLDYQDSVFREVEEIKEEKQVSRACAFDIWYLRTRGRYTQEFENRIVDLHRDGKPVDIEEFGCTEDSERRLWENAFGKTLVKIFS
jgi:hypothetical protein